jgi:hypothetical protein
VTWFKHVLGLPTVLAAVSPATAADSGAFTNMRDSRAQKATCRCSVDKLQWSAEGQLALDAFATNDAPPAKSCAAILALLNNHGLRASQFEAALAGARMMLESAIKSCR